MRNNSLIYFLLEMIFTLQILASKNGRLDALIGPFRHFRLETFRLLNSSVETEHNLQLLRARGKVQTFIRNKFPCDLANTRSPRVPDNVHELRPGDIDVVAGMGDSLTAGAGLMATNVFHIVLEHRGIAPSAGGKGSWRRYLTLPNILKNFNPNLTGYATQNSLTLHAESGLNLGEVAAVSEDTPYMAKVLVQRMKVNPNIDVKKHWKMVTFMIGPNDFCSEICFEKNLTATLERHRKDLIQVLTILKINLPRTIVNLIPPPNLKILTELVGKSFACEISHLVECPCLFGPTSGNRQEIYFKLMEQWQQMDIEIGNSEEFDSDDFTVVVQPFTLDFPIPKTKTGSSDFSYLSEDCFHMSQKGNARIANSLWNNILEPVGAKSHKAVDVFHQIRCPSKEDPFIFTRRNSVRVFNMSNKK